MSVVVLVCGGFAISLVTWVLAMLPACCLAMVMLLARGIFWLCSLAERHRRLDGIRWEQLIWMQLPAIARSSSHGICAQCLLHHLCTEARE